MPARTARAEASQVGAGHGRGRFEFEIAKAQQGRAGGDRLSFIAEDFGHGPGKSGVDECSPHRFQGEAAIDKLRPQGRKEHRQGHHSETRHGQEWARRAPFFFVR